MKKDKHHRHCLPHSETCFCYRGHRHRQSGFTIVELLIVIAFITIFALLTVPYGMDFYREQVLEEQTASLDNNLKLAQSHAVAVKNDGMWGIKFYPVDQDCTNCYVMFQGESYSEREEEYDQVFNFSSGITVEGVTEIVFEKNTGYPHVTQETE